jgi:hypothetical protein
MNVKKRKAARVMPKKKDTELPCPEVAREITGWSAADVVRNLSVKTQQKTIFSLKRANAARD